MNSIKLVPEVMVGGGALGVDLVSESKNGKHYALGPVVEAEINLEYQLESWCAVGLGASYLKFSGMKDEKYGDELDVDPDLSGFSVSAQILFGQF